MKKSKMRKRFLTGLLLAAIAIALPLAGAELNPEKRGKDAPANTASAAPADAVYITTAEELANIGNTDYNPAFTRTARYELANDIEIGPGSGQSSAPRGLKASFAAGGYPGTQPDGSDSWQPYCNTEAKAFLGVLDGRGHKIRFTADQYPAANNYGIIGYAGDDLTGGVEIKDINVALGYSRILGNQASGNPSNKQYIGGIAGRIKGGVIVRNCGVTGNGPDAAENINGLSYTGGLIGIAENSARTPQAASITVSDCYASASISGSGAAMGGLIGIVQNTIIADTQVGSITVSDCYASGNVTGSLTGGLIGCAVNSATYDQTSSITVSGCYASGSVTGRDVSGGLIGELRSKAYYTYRLNGTVMITDCYASGDVDCRGVGGLTKVAGGLIGSIENSRNPSALIYGTLTIKCCYVFGKVTGDSDKRCGGLFGMLQHENTGDTRSTIMDSCAVMSDSVTEGDGDRGRIGGEVDNMGGTVQFSNKIYYNNGMTGPTADIGSITGTVTGTDLITGATLDTLKQKETFTAIGWDFDTVWDITPGVNGGFPYLQAIPPEAPEVYMVTFYDGNEVLFKREVETGNALTRPADPEKAAYVFTGWYTAGGAEWDFGTPVTGDISLYARWREIFTVTFNSMGGSAVVPQEVVDGETADEPEEPSLEGYTFTGWYREPECLNKWDFGTAVTSDMTLYAGWEINKYEATFYDGDAVYDTQEVEHGGVSIKPADPQKEGNTFTGWFMESECVNEWDFDTAITENVSLYAGWVALYTVTFYDGNEVLFTQEVESGSVLTRPEDPEKDSYAFTGWYTEPGFVNKWDFDTPVTGDMSLYAKWQLAIYDEDGELIEIDEDFEGEIEIPVYWNDAKFVLYVQKDNGDGKDRYLESPAMVSITKYTTVELVPYFTVTFVYGDGRPDVIQKVDKYHGLEEPDDTEKEGFVFLGWFTLQEGGELWDFNAPVTKNMTLYARWREIFTVEFDSMGGSGVAPQYVLDGDTAIRPEDPVFEGHTFTGWYTDRECTALWDFDTPVIGSMTLYAGWEVITFEVEFYDGGDLYDTQTVDYGSTLETPAEPVKEGYTFTGWYTEAGCVNEWDFATPVTEEMTLYAGWIRVYTVEFDSMGGSVVAPQEVPSGETAEQPEDPVLEGYTFTGWYTEAGCVNEWNFGAAVTSDMTLYAGWEINKYDVTFYDGDAVYDTQSVKHGDTVTKPADPSKEGNTFTGWYTDEACTTEWDFDTAVTENVSLYAGWETAVYTVIFYDGDTVWDTQDVEHGDTLTKPADPSKEGYTFTGWYTEAGCVNEWDFGAEVTEDMELYAGWEINKYEVTFYDGGTVLDTQSVEHGDTVTKPADPSKEGNTFTGWYTDEACLSEWDFDTAITEDISLYAGWEAAVYTVTFYDGDAVYDTQEVEHGDTVIRPADPSIEGYTFIGWYTEPGCVNEWDFGAEVTEDMELYAKWMHTAEFDSMGGSATEPQLVKPGERLARPADPNREGYIFKGWYTEAEYITEWDFDLGVTRNMILYARWEIITYAADFYDGQELIDSQEIEHGGFAQRPADLEKDGWAFKGWTAAGGAEWDFGAPVTEDITLYALWVKLHTVTFMVDGNEADSLLVEDGETAGRPGDPVKGGYVFIGWMTAGGAEWDFGAPVTEDMTLYAAWGFTVDFDTDGGGAVESQTVREGETAERPADPEKEGFTFMGWYTEPGHITEWDFGTPVTGMLTLYARWADIIYTAEFYEDAVLTETQTIVHGDLAKEPELNEREGWAFKGWYTEAAYITEWDFGTPVTSDIKLYAKWLEIFTVEFDSMGGGTVDSIDVEDGETAAKPADPEKDGWAFRGWYTEAAYITEWDFGTPVTGDMTLYAKWLEVFTVAFDSTGGSAVDSREVIDGETALKPADPELQGYAFMGWYTEPEYINEWDFGTPVTEDMELYAMWKRLYTVAFDSMGGSAVESQEVIEGETAERPADPALEGYTFMGWYTEAEYINEWDFGTPVGGDMTLYAMWEINLYTVTFDEAAIRVEVDGAAISSGDTVEHGKTLIITWEGEEAVLANDKNVPGQTAGFASLVITSDTTLTLTETIKVPDVEIEDEDGNPIDPDNVPVGIRVFISFDEDYFVLYWRSSEVGEIMFTTSPAEIIITASTEIELVEKAFTVTFETDGGTETESQTVEPDMPALRPDDPEKEGYTFTGWFTEDGEEWDFDTPITEDMTLYAGWEPDDEDKEEYEVTFCDGDDVWDAQTVGHGNVLVKPDDPEKEGFIFTGWYTEDGEEWDFDTPVTEDITLYAGWEPDDEDKDEYEIIFYDGDDVWDTQTVEHGNVLVKPDDPEKEGFIFTGWYTEDGDEWDFDTPITEDMTLYAGWEPDDEDKEEYEVTFYDGDDVWDTQTVGHGNVLVKPDDPEKEGYIFKGWFTESGDKWDFDAPVTQDMTLYAGWRSENDIFYDLDYEYENGAVSGMPPGEYAEGTIIYLFAEPDEGYEFKGWYLSPDHSPESLVTTSAFYSFAIGEDTVLYALFIEKEIEDDGIVRFSIEVEGGTVYVEIKGGLVTMRAEAHQGFDFLGWYGGGVRVSTKSVIEFLPEGALEDDETFGLTATFISSGNYNWIIALMIGLAAAGVLTVVSGIFSFFRKRVE